jgi:DNA-binding NtrC family response regulator
MKNDKLPQTGASPGAQARCQATLSNRILVVDDDVNLRQISAEALRRVGFQTETAADGAAAWEALQANSYDLLITDNKMPKLSGVELVKKVRSARMTLPVILASGALPTDELNRNPWLQPVATLVKPFTGGQLLETVNEVLEQPGRGTRGTMQTNGII